MGGVGPRPHKACRPRIAGLVRRGHAGSLLAGGREVPVARQDQVVRIDRPPRPGRVLEDRWRILQHRSQKLPRSFHRIFAREQRMIAFHRFQDQQFVRLDQRSPERTLVVEVERRPIQLQSQARLLDVERDRATLDFDYESAFRTPLIEAYELLILEAMEGDHSLFTSEDAVERAWELLMPVLENPPPVIQYPAGSWGPVEADDLILPRHWHLTPPRAE